MPTIINEYSKCNTIIIHHTLLRRIYSSYVILVAIRPFDLQFLELLIFFYAIAIAIALNAIHRACIDGDYP